MKAFNLKFLLLLLFMSCVGTTEKENTSQNSNNPSSNSIIQQTSPKDKQYPDSTTIISDSLTLNQLTRLVQNMYSWYEESSIEGYGFNFILDDTTYISLENEAILETMRIIDESGYFSQTFIYNYENLVQELDRKMLNKEIQYFQGYYPPYGNGANPWCNCQDIIDDYYNYIEIKNLNVIGDSASFEWTLDQPYYEDFVYEMKAEKIEDEWRISYLQEFDHNSLFGER